MSHFRFCPLSGNWTIISKKRKKRPSDFSLEGFLNTEIDSPFTYGNEKKTPSEIYAIREDGSTPNTSGWKVRVVPNKYNALDIEKDPQKIRFGLYDTMDGFGAHEIIIDTPKFPSSMYDLDKNETCSLLTVIAKRVSDLSNDHRLKYILPFKNHGPMSGATLSHPHTQIIAMPFLPQSMISELDRCRRYFAEHSRPLLEDMIDEEVSIKKRVVFASDNFVVICPFASPHPFTMMIAPRKVSTGFCQLGEEALEELAGAIEHSLARLARATDKASFNILFKLRPPIRDDEREPNFYHRLDEFYGWRIEIIPRLGLDGGLEVATGVRINSVPPEEAAEFLRNIKVQ
jgi:UDPglucose--hexose-1-phosphate uridylyltransferase